MSKKAWFLKPAGIVMIVVACLFCLEIRIIPDIFSHIAENSQMAYDNAANPPMGGMSMAFTWLLSVMALGLANLALLTVFLFGLFFCLPERLETPKGDQIS